MKGGSRRGNTYPRWMAWLASQRWLRIVIIKVFAPIDKVAFRLFKGRRGLSPGRAVLQLTTTGRKTGRSRTTPVLYVDDPPRLWVMASNYGREHHPAWSGNLLANPQATVEVAGERREVIARLATAEEKRAMWPRLLELYPAWKNYETWTEREFRLFCLDPAVASTTR